MAPRIRDRFVAWVQPALLAAAASGWVGVHLAYAQIPLTAQVHVQAAEIGQGVLRSRGTECFVITPTHVVDGSLGPIGLVGDAAVRAKSQLERNFGSDVAVLRLEPTTSLGCPAWTAPPSVDDLLGKHTTGFLLTRESDASLTRTAVTVRASDGDSIYVRPSADDHITQTMSGASLFLGGDIAGMLLSFDGKEGRVLRLDAIVRLTTSHFSPSSASGRLTREVLDSLVGDYNAGSIVVRISLRPDGTLMSQSDSTIPSPLLHERDLRFRVEADPRVAFEFRRDAAGEIFALFSHQPNGVIPAVRQSPERMTREELQALVGSYHAGQAEFIVQLDPKGTLTFAVKGNPAVELLFARDRLFVVRGSSGAYIEFVRGPDRVVTGLIVQGATPIFASRFR